MSRADSSSPAQSSAQTTQRPPRLALLIATGFGLGYFPKAPGTWGSLGGVALGGFFLKLWPPDTAGWVDFTFAASALVFGLALLAVFVVDENFNKLGGGDPSFVVIDEISGQLFVIVFAAVQWPPQTTLLDVQIFSGGFWHGTVNWQYLLAGFILFRVFDVWKPWPVRAAEKLPGGWGIMADDWVAGIYAALCLWGLRALGM